MHKNHEMKLFTYRRFIRELRQHTGLPIIAKPNAGLPDPETGAYDLTPAQYAQAMLACADAGATLLGGCCGTSPEYLRALELIQNGGAAERNPATADWLRGAQRDRGDPAAGCPRPNCG